MFVGVDDLSNLRFWVAGQLQVGARLLLDEALTHRLCRVMRLKVGSLVRLFNGSGVEYLAELIAIGRDGLVAQLQQGYEALPGSPLYIHLVQGIAKGEKMDWIIQKASELGVTEFTPIFTERCDVHLNESKCDKRVQHWQAVAVGAAEQSGRDLPMVIKPVKHFKRWLNDCIRPVTNSDGVDMFNTGQGLLMLHPGKEASSFGEWSVKNSNLKRVVVLIGPEGGWSSSELTMAMDYGIQMVHVGHRILRTETAGIVIAAILQTRWGDLN